MVHYFRLKLGEPLQVANLNALVAQLVEHVLGKDEASGSIPLEGFLKNKSSVTPLCVAGERKNQG